MTDQLALDFSRPRPAARRTDPATSHEAADSMVSEAARHRQIIMDALNDFARPMNAHEIAAVCELDHVQVDRRLSEIERLGLIERTGERGPTPSGRTAMRWRVSG